MGRGGQVSLEAIIQTEMKRSCKKGEADKGTGRKDGICAPRAACSAINRIFCKQGQLSLSKVKDDSLSTDPELSWAWDGIPTFSHRFQDQVLHQLTSTLPFRHERTCF